MRPSEIYPIASVVRVDGTFLRLSVAIGSHERTAAAHNSRQAIEADLTSFIDEEDVHTLLLRRAAERITDCDIAMRCLEQEKGNDEEKVRRSSVVGTDAGLREGPAAALE